ncbi:hypothetical protein HPB49_018830 [Dermacentor silvarum]|uniref:Uncharacterized protein n=1 Tax=Dermacentor silvarum TaxID=543639 RepID=A0ACB8CYU4_DERSI|nr:hypothetical protein HPB49_018830 [Dermacentor silvarum]
MENKSDEQRDEQAPKVHTQVKHSRAHGGKPTSQTATAAASQAVSPITSATASPTKARRQIRRAADKQQSLSPEKRGSPAAVASAPVSPAQGTSPKPSGKGGKGHRATAHHHKGAAHEGPGVQSAASGAGQAGPPPDSQAANDQCRGVAGATSLPVAESKVHSPPTQPDAVAPSAKKQDTPQPEAAQAGPTSQQKTVETAMAVVSPAMQDGKRKKIAITLACFGTILVASSLILYVVSSRRQKSLPFCSTEDCRKHAKLLTDNINWKLDPCEDFAAFVCSARSSSGRGSSGVSVMDSFAESWYGQFGNTLRNGADKISAGKKVLAMYEKCRNFSRDAARPKVFIDFLVSQGLGWPELPEVLPSPLNYILKLAYKWQAPLWISVSLLQSPNQSSPLRRVLINPGMYIPVLWSQHKSATESYAYTKYWDRYLRRLYPDPASRPVLNETVVYETLKVEKDVLDSLNAVFTSKAPKPASFSFGDLPDHVPNVSTSVWCESFQSALLLEPELSLNDTIVVNDVNLLKTIANLFSKYDRKQLTAQLPLFCAYQVEAPYRVLIIALGLVSRFTAEDRKIIDDGFDGLVSAAVDRVQKSQWMDTPSKKSITKKLLAAKKALWPPDALLKDGVLDSIYFAFPGKDASLAEYWIDSRRSMILMNKTEFYEEALRLPWNTLPGYVSYDYALNSLGTDLALRLHHRGEGSLFGSRRLLVIHVPFCGFHRRRYLHPVMFASLS